MSQKNFFVNSEVGTLKKVMLHRPGRELDRLSIDNKDEFLFDDILWVDHAKAEHDTFANLLRMNGAEVFYFEDFLKETLGNDDVKKKLLRDAFAWEALDLELVNSLTDALSGLPAEKLAEVLIAGITKKEAAKLGLKGRSLVFEASDDIDFFINPLPNLYFQRDPFFFIKDCVAISVMTYPARRREALYARYIFNHHPAFAGVDVIYGNEPRDAQPYRIEGGDFMMLSDDCAAIGLSQRSSPGAVQILGERISAKLGIKKILAVDIPKTRAYMHLDTVFTMVDRDAFTVYPGVRSMMKIWELDYDGGGKMLSAERHDDLESCMHKALHIDKVRIIETGGGDPVSAARDQWNDATNTLAIAPGTVVTYGRNAKSNRELQNFGISVLEVQGEELDRGRGGPRCMSMPMLREPVK